MYLSGYLPKTRWASSNAARGAFYSAKILGAIAPPCQLRPLLSVKSETFDTWKSD